MGFPILPLLLALQVPEFSSLGPAANASPRPETCAAQGALWARSVSPELRRACRLLAEAYSKLRSEPRSSLAAAREVQSLGLEGPGKLLLGRAQFRLGDYESAHAAFSRLPNSEPLLGLSTELLRERAAAAQLTGHTAQAVELYRQLVPRIVFLSEAERAGAYVEASLSIAELGVEHWPTARLYLTRSFAEDDLRGVHYLASTALALLGDASRREYIHFPAVRKMIEEAGGPARLYLSPATQIALLAVSAEQDEPAEAALLWKRYLSSVKVPVFAPASLSDQSQP